MDPFALSERWNGWTDLDVILKAARAAVLAGPLDPLQCEVLFESDFDTITVESLEEAQQHLHADPVPPTMELWVAHIIESEASITITYNGRWMQLNGLGSNWERARQAYYAAQVELAAAYGITTFKLPELPKDTVAETRRRLALAELEAALDEERERPADH